MTENIELRKLALGVLMPGFAGNTFPWRLSSYLREGLAAVCLYGENIQSQTQLRALTGTFRRDFPHMLIAIDEEGGDVTRVHYRQGSPFPGNAVLGRIDDLEVTAAVADNVGSSLRNLGVNLDLAPDSDINSNPNNPVIGARSFGSDANLVAKHTTAWVKGLQRQGVAACAKHFPGHGNTDQDSHLSLPTLGFDLDDLRNTELLPFRAAITEGCAAIMTSHILLSKVDPDFPATFSGTILRDLLREEMGFKGVVVTDALDMKGANIHGGIPRAAVRALWAGADLLCLGPHTSSELLEQIIQEIIAAVLSEELNEDDLRAAAARVRSMAVEYGSEAAPAKFPLEELPSAALISDAFRVGDGVCEWILRNQESFAVLCVSNDASLAIGNVPWGPFATEDQRFAKGKVQVVSSDSLADWKPDISTTGLLVIGRGLHLHSEVTEALEELQKGEFDVLTVEMGWPPENASAMRIDTFGASRAVGEALCQLFPKRIMEGSVASE